MKPAPPSRILLSGQDPAAVEEVRRLLAEDGHEVRCHRLGTDPEDLAAHHLAVLESTGCRQESLQWCRRLRALPADVHLPVLLVLDDPSPAARLAGLEAGADANLLRPFAAAELRAQVRAFLHIRDVHAR